MTRVSRSYLATGGAGFIGSHIVERLVKENHKVRVLDNFSSGKIENISQFLNSVELIKGDIRDFETVERVVKDMDFVLHQAALRSVPKSLDDPYEFNAVNIDGTLNLLKASLEARIKRFVFASSIAIYGEADNFPQKEEDSPKLISPYALTKLTGEYYCRIFSQNYGLETVALRYFNVFGPHQALDDEYAVVVPKFIDCMLKDESPSIYGTGKQSRDFIFIDNVAKTNILAATIPDIKCEIINIANGRDNSVLDLIDVLNKIMKKNIEPIFTAPRAGDVFKTLADISKAKKILNFNSEINFEEGLRKTVEWFQKKR